MSDDYDLLDELQHAREQDDSNRELRPEVQHMSPEDHGQNLPRHASGPDLLRLYTSRRESQSTQDTTHVAAQHHHPSNTGKTAARPPVPGGFPADISDTREAGSTRTSSLPKDAGSRESIAKTTCSSASTASKTMSHSRDRSTTSEGGKSISGSMSTQPARLPPGIAASVNADLLTWGKKKFGSANVTPSPHSSRPCPPLKDEIADQEPGKPSSSTTMPQIRSTALSTEPFTFSTNSLSVNRRPSIPATTELRPTYPLKRLNCETESSSQRQTHCARGLPPPGYSAEIRLSQPSSSSSLATYSSSHAQPPSLQSVPDAVMQSPKTDTCRPATNVSLTRGPHLSSPTAEHATPAVDTTTAPAIVTAKSQTDFDVPSLIFPSLTWTRHVNLRRIGLITAAYVVCTLFLFPLACISWYGISEDVHVLELPSFRPYDNAVFLSSLHSIWTTTIQPAEAICVLDNWQCHLRAPHQVVEGTDWYHDRLSRQVGSSTWPIACAASLCQGRPASFLDSARIEEISGQLSHLTMTLLHVHDTGLQLQEILLQRCSKWENISRDLSSELIQPRSWIASAEVFYEVQHPCELPGMWACKFFQAGWDTIKPVFSTQLGRLKQLEQRNQQVVHELSSRWEELPDLDRLSRDCVASINALVRTLEQNGLDEEKRKLLAKMHPACGFVHSLRAQGRNGNHSEQAIAALDLVIREQVHSDGMFNVTSLLGLSGALPILNPTTGGRIDNVQPAVKRKLLSLVSGSTPEVRRSIEGLQREIRQRRNHG